MHFPNALLEPDGRNVTVILVSYKTNCCIGTFSYTRQRKREKGNSKFEYLILNAFAFDVNWIAATWMKLNSKSMLLWNDIYVIHSEILGTWTFSSSGILKTREHNVSVTGAVSDLRWKGDVYSCTFHFVCMTHKVESCDDVRVCTSVTFIA
jgi:hypothetical protein